MKRSYSMPENEPDQKVFEKPSVGEHLFQVVDVVPVDNDGNSVTVKCEVAEGAELGRSLLHRISLDGEWKGFFLTRMFLKALKEPYQGDIEIDTDMWIGKQFFGNVVHVEGNNGKTYANIESFNYEKETSSPKFDE
jgi:hypothetical protein